MISSSCPWHSVRGGPRGKPGSRRWPDHLQQPSSSDGLGGGHQEPAQGVYHLVQLRSPGIEFAFADEPFAIDNEELTPSLKIRHHKIRERYAARIDGLYRG